MKKWWIIPMMLLLATTAYADLGKIKGYDDYDKALEAAKKEGKPVFLLFGFET